MKQKERVRLFIDFFSKNLPKARTELNYTNPFELTVAVILSAQCTDKRVNMITPRLFKSFPNPKVMSEASIDNIFNLIKSCSYPRNKAKYLSGMSNMLIHKFNSEIPRNLEDLTKLPGVGRKTANVILSVVFDIPAMPVDTHVFRVSRRIGFTSRAKTPLQVEKKLIKLFPVEHLNIAHHWLILHGRYICKARKPDCKSCSIKSICSHYKRGVV